MNSSEVAREALKQLAVQKKAPTPDNYRDVYYKIAGVKSKDVFPADSIKQFITKLKTFFPQDSKLIINLEESFNENSLDKFLATLDDTIQRSPIVLNWGNLIKELIHNFEFPHTNLTKKIKIENIDSVISAHNHANQEILYSKIQSLFKHWKNNEELNENAPSILEQNQIEGATQDIDLEKENLISELKKIILVFLNDLIGKLEQLDAATINKTKEIAKQVTNISNIEDISNVSNSIKQLNYSIEYQLDEQHHLNSGLNEVFTLIVDNMDKLILEDKWLNQQIKHIHKLIQETPTPRTIGEINELLKTVILKQELLKNDLTQAQCKLQNMLANFMEQLSALSQSTGDYHSVIDSSAKKIALATQINEITETLDIVLKETKSMELKSKHSHSDLETIKKEVYNAQEEIQHLRAELEKSSQLIRIDSLTGVFNRKGMHEALEKAEAIMKRTGKTLCVALLDIDNFKKVNDSMGHHVGDQALIHLVNIVKKTIRPQDTLARYGGEEFVVILSETNLDDAVSVMARVQRELTTHVFMHDNQKIFITFSCGIAQVIPSGNTSNALIKADEAMYMAKKTGKNKVLAAN